MAKFESIHPSSWKKPRLHLLVEAMRGKRVLVIGDVGVDRYTLGAVERISPEAPVPIVRVESESLKLGLAANVADNVRTLGGVPLMLGVVGKDAGAADLRRLLKGGRIESSHLIEDRSRRTVLKERIVSDRQQLLRVDYESSHPLATPLEAQLLRRARQLLSKCDGVILQDYAKGMLSPAVVHHIFAAAKRARKWVAVDPNLKTPPGVYRGAFVLTPNAKEAEKLAGHAITDLASLARAGATILRLTGAQHLVITRGKDGMAIFDRGSKLVRLIPTYVREVYDVSGAGDTVISVLALALCAGANLEEACILGNLAAGVEVGKRGTATVSPAEVLGALDFFGGALA